MCRNNKKTLTGNINLAPLRPVLNTLFMKQVPAGDAQSLCLVICFGLSKCLFGGLVSDTNRNQVEEQKSKVSCVHRESSVTCWGIVQSKNHIKALSTIFLHIIIIPCTYSIHFNIANIYKYSRILYFLNKLAPANWKPRKRWVSMVCCGWQVGSYGSSRTALHCHCRCSFFGCC